MQSSQFLRLARALVVRLPGLRTKRCVIQAIQQKMGRGRSIRICDAALDRQGGPLHNEPPCILSRPIAGTNFLRSPLALAA